MKEHKGLEIMTKDGTKILAGLGATNPALNDEEGIRYYLKGNEELVVTCRNLNSIRNKKNTRTTTYFLPRNSISYIALVQHHLFCD